MPRTRNNQLPWEGGLLEHVTLSATSLREIPFDRMMSEISVAVLEPVPEGTIYDRDEAMEVVDRQLGQFANLYASLVYLHSFAAHLAEKERVLDNQQAYKDLVRKKDALWELSRAVKLKYQAASRMITVQIEEDEDLPERVDVRKRAEHAEQRVAKQIRKMPGWNAIRD